MCPRSEPLPTRVYLPHHILRTQVCFTYTRSINSEAVCWEIDNLCFVFLHCRCVCSPGYVGDDCSVDYNDCEEHRCQNGAQCVDELSGYSCICPEGYR